MKQPTTVQMEMIDSQRRMQAIPVIGTQILDNNMPSQLNFPSNSHHTSDWNNPEQISWPSKNGICLIKQYNIRGKGLFDIKPKYREGDRINVQNKKFQVKSYNNENSKGLLMLWQSVIGYSKKQLIVQDGQLYITNIVKQQNILKQSYKLTNLLKIFIDKQENKLRLVFKCQNIKGKRFNRDYQVQTIIMKELVEKILLECNVVGMQVVPDDF